MTRNILTTLVIIFFFACEEEKSSMEIKKVVEEPSNIDYYHSYANWEEARITHLDLVAEVDFENKILKATANYNIDASEGADSIIFDTRDLEIKNVLVNGEEGEYRFGETKEYFGTELIVPIDDRTEEVTIAYNTKPISAALQWLEPEQTGDMTGPFLFTQGQAILTRSWIPIQDLPAIRITYDATLYVPPGMMAVMSASNPTEVDSSGTYEFSMEQPIPPYLMALAVGNLEYASLGDKIGVYAEPGLLDSAAYEFADLDKMMAAAENLYGEYLWDTYDIIVLPPSFPFGGMENPRLTFATPTIIAGDRSLTALIAHELAHSWSGNLVTNKTWHDFWLNEGFTVYIERRIMEAIYGEEYSEMLALIGYQDLQDELEELDEKDQSLKLDLAGRDPDEGLTDVAYEKGYFFLTQLEKAVGREEFDDFLKEYFEDHRFKTVTTEEFLDYLRDYFPAGKLNEVEIDEWVYNPGIPEGFEPPKSERFEEVDAGIKEYNTKSTLPEKAVTSEWSTHEWLYFVRQIPVDRDMDYYETLDDLYQFSTSGNSEIAAAWYEKAIYSGYEEQIRPQIEAFLIKVGRRKFLTPLYKAYKEVGKQDIAMEIYIQARPNYHAVSRGTIDKLLNY